MIRGAQRNRKKIGQRNGIAIYENSKKSSKLKNKKTTLKTKTPLKFKSEKQKVKDKNWVETTDERFEEVGHICLWCGRYAERNEINGHHIVSRRYGDYSKSNCYPVHQYECHRTITDENIDVRVYKNKIEWENRDKNEP